MTTLSYWLLGLAAGLSFGYAGTIIAIGHGWLPTPARRPSKATKCVGCGTHHDTGTPADQTINILEEVTQQALLAVAGPAKLLPAAVAIFVPDREGTRVRIAMHPDAFADSADLVTSMSEFVCPCRPCNQFAAFDLHQLRNGEGDL